MISIAQALEIIHKQEFRTAVKEVPLEASQGYWLAEDIASPSDHPPFDNSQMDGYAVAGTGDSYDIVGEAAAGSAADQSLQPGEAMRIFTGAPVPGHTTAVVAQERTRVEGTVLHIEGAVEEGQYIRRAGKELVRGQKVFSAGQPLTPATVGQIAVLGEDRVTVFRKPEAGIISTGSELVAPGTPKSAGQIYESNSYALAAALQRYGLDCGGRRHISDDFRAISEGIADMLDRVDVLLISGGISVGDYDYVKEALEANGVTELFYKVYQKPGKPLYFGRKGDTFVFGLPGNPASALTCFYVYVLPLLQKLSGATKPGLQRINIPLEHDYENRSARPVFLKAQAGSRGVSILEGQSSSMIHSLARANALVYLDGPQTPGRGETVECMLI